MVKVHVWLPDAQHVGHTSLTVGSVYVSFWPDDAAGKRDLKIKRSHAGFFMQGLNEDIHNEGNRQPITVELRTLGEDKILDHVNKLMQDVPRYQLARNNCSHIVANCLIAGAGASPSFTPDAGQYGMLGKYLGRGIWTPDQVLRFARELQGA